MFYFLIKSKVNILYVMESRRLTKDETLRAVGILQAQRTNLICLAYSVILFTSIIGCLRQSVCRRRCTKSPQDRFSPKLFEIIWMSTTYEQDAQSGVRLKATGISLVKINCILKAFNCVQGPGRYGIKLNFVMRFVQVLSW